MLEAGKVNEINDSDRLAEAEEINEREPEKTGVDKDLNDKYNEYLGNNNHDPKETHEGKARDQDPLERLGVYVDEDGQFKARDIYAETREEIRDVRQEERELVKLMEYYDDNKESYMVDNAFEGIYRVLKNYSR